MTAEASRNNILLVHRHELLFTVCVHVPGYMYLMVVC